MLQICKPQTAAGLKIRISGQSLVKKGGQWSGIAMEIHLY